MERLIDNDLIYGGLLQVTQPHLVERYNAALKQFGLSATELGAFSIDATGYSPEIADAFGDEYYLDPHGINRRFIILSPEQGTLPVVNINFSSTTDLVHEFFQQNEEALRVLTLKDVVYGEIDNSTYRIDDLDDILSIKRVDFVVKTAGNLLDKARSLEALLDNFHNDADGWKDDALLNEMLELSRDVGDPRNNAIIPGHTKFEQKSFWTRHFDGIYVFHDDGEEAVVIGREELPAFALGQANLKRYLSLKSYDDVYTYLYNTDRLELWNAAWLEKSEILDLRIKQLIYAAVTRANPTGEPARARRCLDQELGARQFRAPGRGRRLSVPDPHEEERLQRQALSISTRCGRSTGS